MELKIDSEKVKEAAASCGDAGRILKILFPEAFGLPGGGVDLRKLSASGDGVLFSPEALQKAGIVSSTFLQVRAGGRYRNQAFWLDSNYTWSIEHDEERATCLVFKKKY